MSLSSSHLYLYSASSSRDAFLSAYSTYVKFAFGHDDLQPVSLTFNDGRNGWGATIVDAMSTMTVMVRFDMIQTTIPSKLLTGTKRASRLRVPICI